MKAFPAHLLILNKIIKSEIKKVICYHKINKNYEKLLL